jgi:membrane protein DedA with SNARE-associated domain
LKQILASVFSKLLAWGPWGVFLMAVLDSAGIPVVEGVDALIVLVAAKHAGTGYFSAALAVTGSVIGSLFLFYVGRKGGEEFLDRRTQAGWPKRFRAWFHHYGALALFIPVFIPAPLPVKIFVLSAGALGMNRAHFIAIIAVARSLRYFGLAYLGARMGNAPLEFVKGHAWQMALISVAVFLLLFAAVKIKDTLRRRELARDVNPPSGAR